MSEAKPITLDTFLGVNKSATETLLKLGEASNMSNWIITDDSKLSKMFGYAHMFPAFGKKINGGWYGPLNGVPHFIFACNGHVYEMNMSTGAYTDLGIIADAYPTLFFVTNNTVYIIDGDDMYQWNGVTFSRVTGYVPTVFTAAPPTGGGTILESLNYLTGQKIQKFSGNGSATVYQLAELDIDSVDSVTVGGVAKEPLVDYSANLANGTVTFVSAPVTGVNNVVITWTRTVADDRKTITKNQYYGGVYYARFWLYGNPDHKNTRYVSGVTMAGVSDPTYWPVYAESDVGEYEITGIKTQYNKQLIWTMGDSSEASAWYSEEETYTDPSTNIMTTLFPVYPMNSKVGNVAKGQVQLIINNPFTIWKGVYQWISTNVLNEKNAVWMSKRIQNDLDTVDLTKALTVDWSDKGLYFLCVGKKIWVYNYRVDAWYILELAHTPTCFILADSVLYFGTDTGTIMRFDETLPTYDGQEIVATWDMGYYNFGADWIQKFILQMLISILPLTSTHVDIYLSTDRDAAFRFVKTISYGLSNFDTWDFSNFSFETNFSPQPKNVKLKAKKIDYMKIRLVCGGTDCATVLSITLPVRTGGLVKNRS